MATVSRERVDEVVGRVDLLTGALHAMIARAATDAVINFTVSVLVDNGRCPEGTSTPCPKAASLLLETLEMPDTRLIANLTAQKT